MNLTPLGKICLINLHIATVLTFALLLSGCGWVSVGSDESASAPPPATVTNTGPILTVVPGGRSVLVQAGDSVYGIANRYGSTPRQMIALNNLRPPFEIQAGQRLLLPPEQQLYTVRPGDTVSGLAAAYNTDPETLARLNHLPPPYVLHAGSQVGIPTARAPRAAVAARPVAPRPDATPSQPVQPRVIPPRLPPKRPPELAATPLPPAARVGKPATARVQPTAPLQPPTVQRGPAAASQGHQVGS